MASQVVQADYEKLADVAQRFEQCASTIEDLGKRMQRQVDALQHGGWQGRGASAFFQEMNQVVTPAHQRLINALRQGRQTTMHISQTMQEAEDEAAALFRNDADGTASDGAGDNLLQGAGPMAAALLGAALPTALAAIGLSPVVGVLSNVLKGIGFGNGQRFQLRGLTPDPTRSGKSSVAMILDTMKGKIGTDGKPRGVAVLRLDGPDKHTPHPHINRLIENDPHTPVSPRLFKLGGQAAHLFERAGKIAKPLAVGIDIFRLGSAFHADGNQIGTETKKTAGSVAGGWGGALAGAKLGGAGGAALGTFIAPGPGTAIGGFLGAVGGGIAGGVGGSWLGEKVGGWF